ACRRFRCAVGKAVHDAASDEDGFTRRQVDIPAVNPPGCRAAQSINRLVPAVMVMRYRHPRVRLQRHLEHVDAAGGVVLALQESQLERAEVDDFRHGIWLLSANAATTAAY